MMKGVGRGVKEADGLEWLKSKSVLVSQLWLIVKFGWKADGKVHDNLFRQGV